MKPESERMPMGKCEACGIEHDDEAAFCSQCGTRLEGGLAYDSYEYAAFVSYRHLPHDSSIAVRLQRFVEGFTVPKGLRKGGFSKKIGKLFRDEDELPTSSSLSDQIRDALKRSRFLIVVCTPETRESLWVQREVELFASFHGRDRILVALASGEPQGSFPPLLLNRAKRQVDGSLAFEPTEPLAADFRPEAAGKFKSEALRVVAALLGCGYDDLKQRQHARRNALIARIGGAVAAASLAFAGVTLFQQAQILEKQHDLQVSQSRYLASEVDGLLQQGDRMQAVRSALSALPGELGGGDRPYVPEARVALENALQIYPSTSGWVSCYSHREGSDVSAIAASEALGEYAVMNDNAKISVYKLDGGDLIFETELESTDESGGEEAYTDWDMVFCEGQLFAFCPTRSVLMCLDARTGETLWHKQDATDVWVRALSCGSHDDKAVFAVSTFASDDESYDYLGTLAICDAKTGIEIFKTETQLRIEDLPSVVALANEGDKACASFGNHLVLTEWKKGHVVEATLQQPRCADMKIIGDSAIVASVNDFVTGGVMCAIECFSMDGSRVWSFERLMPYMGFQGKAFFPAAEIFDGLIPYDEESPHVIVALGGSLLDVQVDTGAEKELKRFDSPIIDCFIERGGFERYSRLHCA